MNNQSRATSLATAGVVLVILPLLVSLAALGVNVALQSTGAGVSIFGAMGMEEALLAGWSVVAVAVVGMMIAALLQQHMQH